MFCAMQLQKKLKLNKQKQKKTTKKTPTNKLLCVHSWNYKLLSNKMSTDLIYFEIPVQHSKLLQSYTSILKKKKLKRTNNWTEQLNDEQLNASLLSLLEKVHWFLCKANAYSEDVHICKLFTNFIRQACCLLIYILN